MICTVPFRTELTTCPYCHSKLVFHRKRKRPVKTASGNFTALHIIMKCSACNMRFRSIRLSNMALDIFSDIHRENTERLKSSMKSYILQIDGTTDADFRMIVVARDAVSGFILMVKRCYSESHESIKGILERVRKQFGF